MTIEEEIARTLDQHHHVYDSDRGMDLGCFCGAVDEYNADDEHSAHLAQILAPLLNRVRAEAAAEALESAADHINRDFQYLPSWGAAWKAGERTRDWEIGCTRTLIDTIDWLRARAASVRAATIEQNSEGNVT